MDVVKTRLQSLNYSYKNMFEAFQSIAKKEGYSVFFAGMGATAIRAFPTNAATFGVVVAVQNILYDALQLLLFRS